MKDRKPPRSADMLSRWANAYARQTGQDVARVRRWISFMAFGGALEKAGFAGEGPRFSIKGGVALELRLGGRARATKDLDLVLHASDGDLVDALDDLLQTRIEGFTFRRRGAVEWLGPRVVRADVAVQYDGGAWGRIQVDLARTEGSGGMEVEMVEGLNLSFFHFDFPERVPCLSLYAQAAQKIHAVSRPSRPDWQNERFKDLVDLLLIEELIQDHDALRNACEEVFATRNTHPWPPFVEAPANWAEPFRRMATEVGLPVTDVNQAVYRIRTLLHEVDPNTKLFPTVQIDEEVTATTWNYALGTDDLPHRVPLDVAEATILRRRGFEAKLNPLWYRDPGGIVLVEVLVFLHNRVPRFVGGTSIHQIAVDAAAATVTPVVPAEVWDNLASEVARRAKATVASPRTMGRFLSIGERTSSVVIASLVRTTVRGACVYVASAFNSGVWESPVWSLTADQLLLPSIHSE